MNRRQATLLGTGLGAGLGAGLMYLLDPQSGKRRRAVAKDKTASALKQGGTALGKKSRHLGNRGKGLLLEATSKLRHRGEKDLPQLHEESEGVSDLQEGDSSPASLLRKTWAPALCTAATAGLAWAGFRNRDKLGSALSTALFLRDLSSRPAAPEPEGGIELQRTTHVTLLEGDEVVGFAKIEQSDYVPVHA